VLVGGERKQLIGSELSISFTRVSCHAIARRQALAVEWASAPLAILRQIEVGYTTHTHAHILINVVK
jgi:hypothetical protein